MRRKEEEEWNQSHLGTEIKSTIKYIHLGQPFIECILVLYIKGLVVHEFLIKALNIHCIARLMSALP